MSVERTIDSKPLLKPSLHFPDLAQQCAFVLTKMSGVGIGRGVIKTAWPRRNRRHLFCARWVAKPPGESLPYPPAKKFSSRSVDNCQLYGLPFIQHITVCGRPSRQFCRLGCACPMSQNRLALMGSQSNASYPVAPWQFGHGVATRPALIYTQNCTPCMIQQPR